MARCYDHYHYNIHHHHHHHHHSQSKRCNYTNSQYNKKFAIITSIVGIRCWVRVALTLYLLSSLSWIEFVVWIEATTTTTTSHTTNNINKGTIATTTTATSPSHSTILSRKTTLSHRMSYSRIFHTATNHNNHNNNNNNRIIASVLSSSRVADSRTASKRLHHNRIWNHKKKNNSYLPLAFASSSNAYFTKPYTTTTTTAPSSYSYSYSYSYSLNSNPWNNLLRATSCTSSNNRGALQLFSSSSNNNNSNNNNNNKSVSKERRKELLDRLMPTHDENGVEYSLYERCVRRLYLTNLFHPVKMGLTNIERLNELLGKPMDEKKKKERMVIHVAGTNGKGSVCWKLAKTLELAGYKTGLFVSPHVSSFRERMQVNSQPISEQQVEEYLPYIYQLCEEHDIPATFFEVTTALAFHFFDETDTDVVVLETGLGGRLDATNVIVHPALTIITSIGLEHTRILGDTVEAIAKEKAGIIKPNVPLLVGPNVPHSTLQHCAKVQKAEGYYTMDQFLPPTTTTTNDDTSKDDDECYVDYDVENSCLVQAALELLKQKSPHLIKQVKDCHIENGIAVRPPCRFEEIHVENHPHLKVLLDVAHNPPAIQFLIYKLKKQYPGIKKRIIIGFSSDKDIRQCASILFDNNNNNNDDDDDGISVDRLHIVEAAHPRAAKLEDILNADPRLQNCQYDTDNRSVTYQVQRAVDQLSNTNTNNNNNSDEKEMIVICGSVFLMAEAREALGFDEPRDSKYIAEVAGMNLRFGQENFANMGDPEKKQQQVP